MAKKKPVEAIEPAEVERLPSDDIQLPVVDIDKLVTTSTALSPYTFIEVPPKPKVNTRAITTKIIETLEEVDDYDAQSRIVRTLIAYFGLEDLGGN